MPMPANCEILISNELPGIGRVIASIYTTHNTTTDKLQSEILYWSRLTISGGMRLFADPGQIGPVTFDKSFLHAQAREWLENTVIFEQNELYLKTRDQCFIGIRPVFSVLDEGGIMRIWFGSVESAFVKHVARFTDFPDLKLKMEQFMRLPQVELLPIKITDKT